MRYEIRQNELWRDEEDGWLVSQSYKLAEVDIDLGWSDAEIVRAVSQAAGLNLRPEDWMVEDLGDDQFLDLIPQRGERKPLFSLHKIEE